MLLSAVPAQPNEFLAVSCLSADAVGDVVYFTGVDAVARVVMTDRTKGPGVGIIIKKRGATSAVVQTRGIVRNVYAGLPTRSTLFVSDDGGLTALVPSFPSTGIRYIHRFAKTINPTTLLLLHETPIVLNA
jgi:hypothetical protein